MLDRRGFIRLSCAFILGLKLGLPLGQTEIETQPDSNALILEDVKKFIELVKNDYSEGPYFLVVPEQWADRAFPDL